MPSHKKIYLSIPHLGFSEEKLVTEAMQNGWVSSAGPQVIEFEKKLSEYLEINETVAMSSGTAALHLALKILNVSTDDLVFCSSLTFIASANPILYEKAVPVFIDSEEESWNMSPKALEEAFQYFQKMGKKPKAVIVADIYGIPANYDEIQSICSTYNVPLIEDAAEALGSTYKNKKCGSFGDLAILSFNGNKIITTSGGGMLVTKNSIWAKKSRYLSTQARQPVLHYEHNDIGYNYRLSNIAAAIGVGQMEVLDSRVKRRRQIFQFYKNNLKSDKIQFMPEPIDCFNNCWLSTIVLKNFDYQKVLNLIHSLEKNNIESRPLWKPLHTQPIFKSYNYFGDGLSEKLFAQGICLPSSSCLTEEELNIVCQTLLKLI